MVNLNLIRGLDSNEENWDSQVEEALNGALMEESDWGGQEISSNQITEGKIVRIEQEKGIVIVDIGYKSEGVVPLNEWDEDGVVPVIGDVVKVLIEEAEDEVTGEEIRGMINLSKKKAAKIEAWDNMMKTVKENDVITGHVMRKVKGGLLVDIGVPVFLPASQVDVRRPNDIGEFLDIDVQCMILKIDEIRRNIVVSRRAVIEKERIERRTALLNQLNEGEIRKGTIKNIAEFGAFIDLGGIDGLLHITDMSWGRINNPNEMVKFDQEVEVVILSIDREKEKISLGLKQKTASPWMDVETRYPVGSRVKGLVVNVMSYGAFVKLEEGVEGLVHISEMSWTKRISHPNEILSVGETIEVVVLMINKERQEISLGIKQAQENPWDIVDEKYPIGQIVNGIVRNLTNYGAFIEIEEGIDGLLHISDMSWVRKITHPNEVVNKGQKIKCQVLSIDKKNHRIALGLKQLTEDPWESKIPAKYQPNQMVKGVVTKITNFGVFINLEEDLEGLLHISELANHKIENPGDVVKVGEEIEVKVLRVDPDERKIGLSRKRAEWAEDSEKNAAANANQSTNANAKTENANANTNTKANANANQSAANDQLKGGIGDSSGSLFK
ncbi:MAG: 30S ribosomal protein S1 [Planctomycetaceae bacterium]|nr:30S ribosomal protein S1 [Planctomycetaceae bacterium]